MSKIIHVPFCFYPDPVGGTEVYVANLAQELRVRGVEVVIAAPSERTIAYLHDGLHVRRFAINPIITDLREQYGDGDLTAAREFGRLLDDECPDLVHLHASTRAVSVRLVREAKRRDIPVVFTYHTPTVSCLRGTLLRWGTEICDGLLDLGTCTRCALHGLGLPRPMANALGCVPMSISGMIGAAHLSGSMWTALRMREMASLRHTGIRSQMNEVDHIFALCQWTRDLLLRNGVPATKITVVRHGISQIPANAKSSLQCRDSGALRLVALGRLDPTKGFDILIRALRQLPDAKLQLDIYGIAQGESEGGYSRRIELLAAGDSRIRFMPSLPSDQVISVLRSYDLLAVPSQVLETGPLVILEAFAAGIPVIGSNLGGIAELVTHGVDGLLVDAKSVIAWRQTLHRCTQDRDLLPRLEGGIRPPRTMMDVVNELSLVYRESTRDKSER